MTKTFFMRAIPGLALALMVGCNDTDAPSTTGDANTPSAPKDDGDGVAKIAVMSDGTVYVNSETVAIDSLGSKLDKLEDIKEIWYHREAPDAAEPHENAMKAIAEIANRRLPIAMYLDRDFKQRATFGD